MTASATGRIDGNVRVTLRLDALHAIDPADVVGKGDWELRVWINGLERWRTPRTLQIGQDETVAIGESIVTEVPEYTDMLEIEVQAREKDLLNPDDYADGMATLYRSLGFRSPDDPLVIDIRGEGHLRLTCAVEVAVVS